MSLIHKDKHIRLDFKKMISTINIIGILLMCLFAFQFTAFALVPADHVVMVSAVATDAPPQIQFSWSKNTNNSYYDVYRKSKTDSSWGTAITRLASDAVGWTDTNVEVGIAYEYQFQTNNGAGYIYSGINIPTIDNRGKVILVVDNTIVSQLNYELKRLEQDIIGDGWEVIRHDVARTDTPLNVRNLIKADYNSNSNVKTVFLLGHVPILKSGFMAPDGHEMRSFPADGYYGDMDGNWTDSNGDGIYDDNVLPSDVELQVGRVDMWNLPAFNPLTEAELLKRYLDKDHKYRQGLISMQRRGFIQDNFGEFGGEGFARNGWGNFPQLTNGASAVSSGVWRDTLINNDYLWSYICGGGSYDSISSTALKTSDFTTNKYKTIFSIMFGSYFGEWDAKNDLLRGFLAMQDYGLTNAWGGRPNWFFHHMGLGENIGYSAKLVQNNSGLYAQTGNSSNGVHIALMGDPTLRLYPIMPPSKLTICENKEGKAFLNWTQSTQTVLGYYVYRANDLSGSFERITNEIVTGTSFTDIIPYSENNKYMVRAVILEKSASGSFYNTSQAAMQEFNASALDVTKKMQVTGYVTAEEKKEVAIKVIDPEGELCYLDQVTSDADGKFSFQFSPNFKRNGVYSIYECNATIDTPLVVLTDFFVYNDFYIGPISYLNSSGAKLTQLLPSTQVKIKSAISNNRSTPASAKFIVGLYRNVNGSKHLEKIEIINGDFLANQTKTIESTFSLPQNVDNCFLKTFVFEGLDSIRSLGKTELFEGSTTAYVVN